MTVYDFNYLHKVTISILIMKENLESINRSDFQQIPVSMIIVYIPVVAPNLI